MISRDVCPVFMSVNNVLTASSTSLNFFSATLRISNSGSVTTLTITHNLPQLTRKDKKKHFNMTQLARRKSFKRRKIKQLAWCLSCVVLFCLLLLLLIFNWRNITTGYPLPLLMRRNNLVPRVFSFSNMAATEEKIQRSFLKVKNVIPMLTSLSTWSFITCEKQEGLQRNKVTFSPASSQRPGH